MSVVKDCVFCKIISGEEPVDFIYQDDKVVAFNDLNRYAKVHILVVPRKHISSIQEMKEEDEPLIGHLVRVAKKIAQDKGLKGYHLIFNVGVQEVFHIHLHLVSSDAQQIP